jgi:hypothetical protein
MMYLYTEFPNFDTNRILWYLLRKQFRIVKSTLDIMKNNKQD